MELKHKFIVNDQGDAIAIRIIDGSHTKSSIQFLCNQEDLPVRDYRIGAIKVDYFPQYPPEDFDYKPCKPTIYYD